jgi:molybdopterin-guanine dinucleotide biosynthesis protein A
VTADLINHLLDRSADADVVVPHTDRGYHPLCAVYGRACLGPIEQHLAERRLKITHLFSDVRTHAIDANELSRFGEPRRLLSNVNTPHDHAALHASQDHEL